MTAVGRLSHADVSVAVVFLGSRYQAGSMRTVVTAVRVLCRFLEDAGYSAGLFAAVPAMFSRRTRSVAVLPADRIEQLINSPGPATPKGLRDRALLLLAARTGLRPVDIVGLRLGDIDTTPGSGRVTLTDKGRKARVVPIMDKTGRHLDQYLNTFHPDRGADAALFFTIRAGRRYPMRQDNVSYLLNKHAAAARQACPEIPERVHAPPAPACTGDADASCRGGAASHQRIPRPREHLHHQHLRHGGQPDGS